MISHPQLGQFEHEMDKFKRVNTCCIAMLSGNPLHFDAFLKGVYGEKDFDKITKDVQQNMITMKENTIKTQVFDIYKIDHDYIKTVLKGQLMNPYITNVVDQISKFTLQTNLLLIGFKNDEAQIAEITESVIANLRDINFDAIGSGAIQALNTLLFQHHSKNNALSTTIYNVYKAKRNAEVAVGVGKETDMRVLTNKDLIKIDEEQVKVLCDIYERELEYGKTDDKLDEMVAKLF